MKKPRKQLFSKIKAVKENARTRVGTPPPGQVLPDDKDRSRPRGGKHKQSLSDLLNRTGDEQ
jgi:hypothetical protein